MQKETRLRSRIGGLRRTLTVVCVGAAAALAAGPAQAEAVGRFCTFATCAGSTQPPWSAAIGFGAAALAAGWIARRREPQRP